MAGPGLRSSPRRHQPQEHDDDTQQQQQEDQQPHIADDPAASENDNDDGADHDDATTGTGGLPITATDTARSALFAAVRGLLSCVLLWNVAVHCHLAYTVFFAPIATTTPPAIPAQPSPSPATVMNVKVKLPPAPTGIPDHVAAAEARAAEAERAAREAASEARRAAAVRAAAEEEVAYAAARAEEDAARAELDSLRNENADDDSGPSPMERFAERVEALRIELESRSKSRREQEEELKSKREGVLAASKKAVNKLKRDLAMAELKAQKDTSGIGRSRGRESEDELSVMLPHTRVVLELPTLSDLSDEELEVVFERAIDELERKTGNGRSYAAAVDRLDPLLRHMAANVPPLPPQSAIDASRSSACKIEIEEDGISSGGGGDDEDHPDLLCEDCATQDDLNEALAPLREYLTQRYTFGTPASAHYRKALRDKGGGGFSSGRGAQEEEDEPLPSPLMGPATDRVREKIERALLDQYQKARQKRADAKRKREEARWLRRAQRIRDEAAELIRPPEERCVEVDTLRDMLDRGLDASIGSTFPFSAGGGGVGGDGGGVVEEAVRAVLHTGEERGDDGDDNDDDDYVDEGERGYGRRRIELNTKRDILSPLLGYAAINETLTRIPPLLGLSSSAAAMNRSALHLLDSPLLHSTLRKIDDVTEEYVLGHSELIDDWYDAFSSIGSSSDASSSIEGGSLHSAFVYLLASVPLSVPESASAIFAKVNGPLASLWNKIDGAVSKLPYSVQRGPWGAFSLGRNMLTRAVRNFGASVAPSRPVLSVRRTVIGGGATAVTLPLCSTTPSSGGGKMTLAFDVLSKDGLTEDGMGEIELDSMELAHASSLAGSGSPLERSILPVAVSVTGVGHDDFGTFHLGRYELATAADDDENDRRRYYSFPVGQIGVDQGGVPLSDLRQILVEFELDGDDGPPSRLVCIGGLRLLGRVVPREEDSEDYSEDGDGAEEEEDEDVDDEDYVAAGCAADGGPVGAGGDGSCGAEPSLTTTTGGLNDSTTAFDDEEDDSDDDDDLDPDDVDQRHRERDDHEHDPHVDEEEEEEEEGAHRHLDEEEEEDDAPPLDDEDDEEARWYRERYGSDTDTASQNQEHQEQGDPLSDVVPPVNESEEVHDEPREAEAEGEDRYEDEAVDAMDAAVDGQQHDRVVGDDGDEMAAPSGDGEDDEYQRDDHDVAEADEGFDVHPSGDVEDPTTAGEEGEQPGEGDQQSAEESASAGDEPEDIDGGERGSHIDGDGGATEQHEEDGVGGDDNEERMDGDDHSDAFSEDDVGEDDYDELGALSSEFEDIADHGEHNDLVSVGALREWEEVDELIRENVITEDDFDDMLDRVDTTTCSRGGGGEDDEGGECLDLEGFMRFNSELDMVLSAA